MQAFRLGRYPLHFHMMGSAHTSYIRGASVHETFNRGVVFHGVHFFEVSDTVAYNNMGHTFFIEDAIESQNKFVSSFPFYFCYTLLDIALSAQEIQVYEVSSIVMLCEHTVSTQKKVMWCRITNNLALWTRSSASLLDTDTTPASFWITFPTNFFTGNVAAGSERYGFWFDLQKHPTGTPRPP